MKPLDFHALIFGIPAPLSFDEVQKRFVSWLLQNYAISVNSNCAAQELARFVGRDGESKFRS